MRVTVSGHHNHTLGYIYRALSALWQIDISNYRYGISSVTNAPCTFGAIGFISSARLETVLSSEHPVSARSAPSCWPPGPRPSPPPRPRPSCWCPASTTPPPTAPTRRTSSPPRAASPCPTRSARTSRSPRRGSRSSRPARYRHTNK